MARNIAVLGCTGSIGRQTLEVAREMGRKRIRVFGLAAHRNAQLLQRQVEEFGPRYAALGAAAAHQIEHSHTQMLPPDRLWEMITHPDVDLVVVGTAGSGGLQPTLDALRANKLVALANKEVLVMAGALIQRELEAGHGRLVPIDSEHSAIWQCLQGEPDRSIERLTLTASGGALRHLSVQELDTVTPEQALNHPTWSMGHKITVDSANLMNKGLEVLEAHWLFDVPMEKVEVVLHPQSIVHSLVTFDDSSTKAQLGLPDMRLPIQYALSHPERWPNTLPRLDLGAVGQLTFEPIDLDRYPALRIALEAGRLGDTYPAVLSAADEVAVEAFLAGKIRFTRIPDLVGKVLERHRPCRNPDYVHILESDEWARHETKRLVSA